MLVPGLHRTCHDQFLMLGKKQPKYSYPAQPVVVAPGTGVTSRVAGIGSTVQAT